MTDVFDAAQAGRQAFLDWIVEPNGLDSVTAWPNATFEPPDANNPESLWLRYSHLEGYRQRITVSAEPGQSRWRQYGTLVIQLFQPRNTGDRLVRRLGDQVVTAYTSKSFQGMRFRTPQPQAIGNTNAWYQYQVTIPFEYDITL